MDVVNQNMKVYTNVIINSKKVKTNFLEEFLKNIFYRSPLLKEVDFHRGNPGVGCSVDVTVT